MNNNSNLIKSEPSAQSSFNQNRIVNHENNSQTNPIQPVEAFDAIHFDSVEYISQTNIGRENETGCRTDLQSDSVREDNDRLKADEFFFFFFIMPSKASFICK